MATIQLEINRETLRGNTTVGVGSAITGDVNVVFEDTLTTLEVTRQLEKIIQFLQEENITVA